MMLMRRRFMQTRPLLTCLLLFATVSMGGRPIDQVQKEYDRTAGRLTDEATHQLDKLEQPSQRPIDDVQDELERRDLQRKLQAQQAADRAAVDANTAAATTRGAVAVLEGLDA